jgi:hypothetical protein
LSAACPAGPPLRRRRALLITVILSLPIFCNPYVARPFVPTLILPDDNRRHLAAMVGNGAKAWTLQSWT